VREGVDSPRPRAVPCERCRALNGAGFDRCIRCGAAISPLARSTDRLRAGVDPSRFVATKAILAITFFAFSLQAWLRLRRGDDLGAVLFSSGGHVSRDLVLRFGALEPTVDVLRAEPWRLLSAIFVHYDGLHLLLNMLALTSVARDAEPTLGSARLALTYVATGIAGFAASAAYLWLSHAGVTPVMAGASGAFFGVMGLVLGYLIQIRSPLWKRFAVRVVLMTLLIGFAMGRGRFGLMTNHLSHFVGLALGSVFGMLFASAKIRRSNAKRSDLLVNVAAAAGLLACVASLVLAQLSPRWQQGPQRSSSSTSTTLRVDSDR
jgi:membrane associated rhomboid family serine protease